MKDWFYEPHVKPIWQTIHPQIIQYTHLLRVESLNDDIRALASDMGLRSAPKESSRLHASRGSVRSSFEPSKYALDLIKKIYEQDYAYYP